MLYVPVLHRGYDEFLEKYGHGSQVLIIGQEFAEHYPVIRKEIRALSPARAATYIRSAAASDVLIVEPSDLPEAVTGPALILPDEDLMREIAESYRLGDRAELSFQRTFLRWDRPSSEAERPPRYAGRVTSDQLADALSRRARDLADRSSDWWRQVGALVVRGDDILATAYNEHQPSPYSPYVNGDPRNNFRRGVRIDLSTAIHAEAAVVGHCARKGIPLDGADLYVSTFPCPPCARLIAAAGFARCFFASGYSTLDGDDILRSTGVEPIFVMPEPGGPYQLSFDDIEGARVLGL